MYTTALLRRKYLTRSSRNSLTPGLKGTELLLHWSIYSFSLPATTRELYTLHIFTRGGLPSWNHSVLTYSSLVPCTTSLSKWCKVEIAQGREPLKTQIWRKRPSSYSNPWISGIIMSINICSYLWKHFIHFWCNKLDFWSWFSGTNFYFYPAYIVSLHLEAAG